MPELGLADKTDARARGDDLAHRFAPLDLDHRRQTHFAPPRFVFQIGPGARALFAKDQRMVGQITEGNRFLIRQIPVSRNRHDGERPRPARSRSGAGSILPTTPISAS